MSRGDGPLSGALVISCSHKYHDVYDRVNKIHMVTLDMLSGYFLYRLVYLARYFIRLKCEIATDACD